LIGRREMLERLTLSALRLRNVVAIGGLSICSTRQLRQTAEDLETLAAELEKEGILIGSSTSARDAAEAAERRRQEPRSGAIEVDSRLTGQAYADLVRDALRWRSRSCQ
jgi:hypothetical protein